MLATLATGRIGIAAMAVGAAPGAFEIALAHAQQRQQFGEPIIEYQGVSFPLADMATEIEHARTFLHKVCWLVASGRPFRKEAAMAKLYSSEVAARATDAAVQVLGGYGLMAENDVERLYRDARLLRIGEGTSEIQRLVIGRQLRK